MSAGELVLKDIVNRLNTKLSQCGIMYRIFSRIKSTDSINHKMEKKGNLYRQEKRKLQDLLALRITLYFTDDVNIVYQYLKNQPNFVNESIDVRDVDTFKPTRLNLVMRVPEIFKEHISAAINDTNYPDLIDDTYEIQIRTILSEGWHEVEHDLRYKYKDDWNDFQEESRLLNGIFASLESNEWAMLSLFERLAYAHYKRNEWDSMLRNKLRIRFANSGLSAELKEYLLEHQHIAKLLFRTDRSKVLGTILEKGFSFPLIYDTTLHLLNHICVKDVGLAVMEDAYLKEELDNSFGEIC